MSTEIIRVIFTVTDVEDMALEAGIEKSLAVSRALEWAKYIEDSARGLCSDQLYDAINLGQP